jgi:hypothetical protein
VWSCSQRSQAISFISWQLPQLPLASPRRSGQVDGDLAADRLLVRWHETTPERRYCSPHYCRPLLLELAFRNGDGRGNDDGHANGGQVTH